MTNRTRRTARPQLDVTYRTATGETATARVTSRGNGYATTNADVAPDCIAIITVAPAPSAAADARNAAHAAAIDAARAGR